MKILYGVQGTGEGHLSRARAMARALAHWPVDVTWLFSGRPREQLFDMSVFGDYLYRTGLSFTVRDGQMQYAATLRNNRFRQCMRDASQLDLSSYDLLVCDYEPVLALAARKQQRSLIGIGHQYAFGRKTPTAGASFLQRQIMSRFAPVDTPVGLHWHRYADNILPPILDLPAHPVHKGEHIVVYMPFEDQQAVTRLLQRFPEQRFLQYSAAVSDSNCANVERRKANVAGFKRDLASSAGVICNSGFELVSECLQWRKPVLTKPLHGQMEQLSNAHALQQLGYATSIHRFDTDGVAAWLDNPGRCHRITFPDVAGALARWLATGAYADTASLGERLWAETVTDRIPVPRPGRYGAIASA
ncbi:hypothetical protein F0M18_11370 [Pseudohalioglobus sediminis]|uniref:Glycosyltransferase n=1 Tax=Pseudohalioglobus sediminis TaxID=2606449 RepID=A0A5B0WWZ4_9GAMM|nr:MJ1255/VC2487 family glycosyltransferase [Pseudohalioglobus sediminis]KAA1190409.1 hypothetical protein F0M18_11370 [Pseudohalioglobus sediminis]